VSWRVYCRVNLACREGRPLRRARVGRCNTRRWTEGGQGRMDTRVLAGVLYGLRLMRVCV